MDIQSDKYEKELELQAKYIFKLAPRLKQIVIQISATTYITKKSFFDILKRSHSCAVVKTKYIRAQLNH